MQNNLHRTEKYRLHYLYIVHLAVCSSLGAMSSTVDGLSGRGVIAGTCWLAWCGAKTMTERSVSWVHKGWKGVRPLTLNYILVLEEWHSVKIFERFITWNQPWNSTPFWKVLLTLSNENTNSIEIENFTWNITKRFYVVNMEYWSQEIMHDTKYLTISANDQECLCNAMSFQGQII